METFITVLHIVVALTLIGLVLIQDSKSGSLGGAFGGGGSNSVLGATGATTLAQKLTRYTAVVFAVTSIGLSVLSSRSSKSVMDVAVPAAATAPVETPAPTGSPADANAAVASSTTTTAPASSTTTAPKK